MNCQSCGSDDVVKASAFYEQSASSFAAHTSIAGVGAGGGGLGVGVAGGSTYGGGATLAAQRLAPPGVAKPSPLPGFAIFLGGLIAIFLLGSAPLASVIIVGAAIAFAMWFGGNDKKSRNDAYAIAFDKWNRLWYCKRCGAVETKPHV
jgi:hypothetical protein